MTDSSGVATSAVGAEFSSDPSRLDAAWVHWALSEHAYWALGRCRQVQDAANAGSRCYGLYLTNTGEQVAFARVVTDGVTFGWLCDVIVDPAHQGRGLGRRIVQGLLADLEPLGLNRLLLVTGDAHGLYEQYGWEVLTNPQRWMVRARVDPAQAGISTLPGEA